MPSPLRKKGHPKIGGRKKGTKNKKTILKEQAFIEHQQAILKELSILRDAHFAVAKGTKIVLARDNIWDDKKKKKVRKGRFIRITNEEEILELMNSKEKEGEDYYIIFTQDPNPKALEDLINRVFGKPKEELDLSFAVKNLKEIQDGVKKVIELALLKRK